MDPATKVVRFVDVLSEVLQQVRLTGAVMFGATLSAPWCVAARPERAVIAELMPATSHLIEFHVVLEGRISAGLVPSEPQQVCAGEVLIVPHGDAHLIGDTLLGPVLSKAQLYGDTPMTAMRHLVWGGEGVRTRLICGYLGCERSAFTPLFSALPRLFKVRLGGDSARSLDPLLGYAEQQALSSCPGAAGLRLRMAELMFVEALRRYMEGLPETGSGWLAGLRDPLVGRALALLHAAPERRWTVDELAHASATSRSRLADRFTQVLGEPPMQYLARWRMLLAARRLRDSRDSIAAVAEAVGYESSAAFQRGFTRRMGTTPARWRRQSAAVT